VSTNSRHREPKLCISSFGAHFSFVIISQYIARILEVWILDACIPSIEKKTCKDAGNKQLPQSVVKCIQDFYLVDSISCQAAAMRDYVIVRTKGKKTKL